MIQYQLVISCDWYQIFGRCDQLHFHNMYVWERMDYSSRQFRDIWIVKDWSGLKVATIQKNPFSSAIDKDLVICQFSNEVLYRPNWASACAAMLRDFGIFYKGLSRVDICADFQEFKSGRSPLNFIRDVVACKLLHNGRAKMHFIATQTSTMNYETFKIGSPTSMCDVKLYNKSQEMRDVKTKPHIIAHWEQAGFDKDKDVWRLEFSIKSNSIKVLTKDTAELRDIDARFLQFDGNVKMLYKILYEKYFDFRVADNQKNKSRMARIDLFNWASASAMLYRSQPKESSNRADKIFLKKLHLLKNDLCSFPQEVADAQCMLESYFIFDKDLMKFYDAKISRLTPD